MQLKLEPSYDTPHIMYLVDADTRSVQATFYNKDLAQEFMKWHDTPLDPPLVTDVGIA